MAKSDLFNYAGSSMFWEAEDITAYFEESINEIFGEKLARLRMYQNDKLITPDTKKIEHSDDFDLKFELILKHAVENQSDDQFALFYGWIGTVNDIVKKKKFSGTPELTFTPYEKDKKYIVLSFSLSH